MKCAKLASAPAYRAASAAQYSLGAGAMRSKKVFFYIVSYFFKKVKRAVPWARCRARLWTALPSHMRALAHSPA